MFKNNKRILITVFAVALILIASIGGTIAYLVDVTPAVVNEFTPAEITVDIPEQFDGEKKSNVEIQNTGNIKAYIRATVVGNWVINDNGTEKIVAQWSGNISGKQESGWFYCESDKFYYYRSAVEAGAKTSKLIDSTGVVDGEKPTDYPDAYLELTVLAQAIQAEPTSTVEAVWGVTVDDDGNISK